jgi:phosphoribosylcarboxyaminoimidazole (NCAIR) mutase
MEGALPSVVAGHLPCPIFAVPTSVGYGTTLGGLTPLMGMLSSCAANVAAVNIDAGFKGGYLAGLVVRQLQQISQRGDVPSDVSTRETRAQRERTMSTAAGSDHTASSAMQTTSAVSLDVAPHKQGAPHTSGDERA